MENKEIRRVADRIRSNQYRIYNKELAHYLGLNAAIYISYLVDQDYFFHEETNNIGDWFYKQQYYIYYETTLNMEVLRKLNNQFIKIGLIEIKKIGLPAKNNFRINYDILEKIIDESSENFKKLKLEFLENQKSSSLKIRELEPLKEGNINNKEINNKYTTFININAEEPKNSSYISEDKNNKKENNNENDVYDNSLVGEEVTKQNTPTLKPPAEKPKKGLGPLLDEVNSRYKQNYPNLVTRLDLFLHSFIGRRRLPDLEKWKQMLNDLEDYSSIIIPGTAGKKFIISIAIEIVDKAINGNGEPFTEFDNIYGYGGRKNVTEPQFNLNQDFTKGY